MEERTAPTQTIRRVVLVVLAIGISVLFLRMIQAFILALLLAAIFAALLHPLHRRLLVPCRGRRYVAAAAVVILMLLAVVGPLTGLVGILVNEAVNTSRSVRPWVEEQLRSPSELQARLEALPLVDDLLPDREAVVARAGELVGRIAGFVTDALAAGTRGTARFLLLLFVMLYALFFFLVDGRAVLDRLLYYLPLSAEDERRMLDRFGELDLALAGYNAGPTVVERYGTIPPYPETRRYVDKVLGLYRDGGIVTRRSGRIGGPVLTRRDPRGGLVLYTPE